MLDELKSIIAGWTGICSAWNDEKSKKVENEVIYPLENAIRVLEDEVTFMAGNSVVVHDVDVLEAFGSALQGKRDELENLYVSLSAETLQQETNWQDPQYEYLKEQVTSYCETCKGQLDELDESISYIVGLVAKLRDM